MYYPTGSLAHLHLFFAIGINMAIDKFLFDLHTIAGFQAGGVVDVLSEYIEIQQPCLSVSFDRLRRGEDRWKAVARFEFTVIMVYDYCILLLESIYLRADGIERDIRVNCIKRCINGLKLAIPGLQEWCRGYESSVSGMAAAARCRTLIIDTAEYIDELCGRLHLVKIEN